ncbi:hypothetical protein FOZ60_014271 [Perkinsus olseni]|uniref:Uncharacterized protein n=1 Tax=Perkinsus olseni TaxID=32597 RepID=A0A7J6N7T0_PEROL|nr:hypothetical protein FOZ60_014271 [Perkinsus olseni]
MLPQVMVPEHPQENAAAGDWWSSPCDWEEERSSSPHEETDKEARQKSLSISSPNQRGKAERMSSERHCPLPDECSTVTAPGGSKFPRDEQSNGSRGNPETAVVGRAAVSSRNVDTTGVTVERPSALWFGAKVESEAPRRFPPPPLVSRGSRVGGAGGAERCHTVKVARDTCKEGRSIRRKRSKRRRSDARRHGKKDDHLRLRIGGGGGGPPPGGDTTKGGSEPINWRSRLQQPRGVAIPRRPTEHRDWFPPVGRDPTAIPRRAASTSKHLSVDDYDHAHGGGESEGTLAVVLSPAGRRRRSRSHSSIARRRAADCDQDFTNAEQSESIDGSPIGDAEGLCDATVEPRSRDKRRRSRRCISASFERHLQREATKPLEGIKVELLTSEEARRGAVDQHRKLRLSSTLRRRESSSDTTPTATPRVVKLGSAGYSGDAKTVHLSPKSCATSRGRSKGPADGLEVRATAVVATVEGRKTMQQQCAQGDRGVRHVGGRLEEVELSRPR